MSSLLTPEQALEAVETRLQEIGRQTGLVPDLEEPIRYFLELGGKRIRPVLFVLTYQSVNGGGGRDAVNAACAVELFHNFSLLHDDIMDNSTLRRGKETVHVRWDANRAILAGDAMFALSMEYLVRDFPFRAHRLITEYARVSAGVCDGQMEDMAMAGQLSPMPRYIEMIRRKTAMLLGGSMSLAAIAAGGDEDTVQALYHLGEMAGIGFQLQDDFLDAFPPDGAFGKKVGGDIIEGKMTFLVIRAHQLADADTQRELMRLLLEEKDPAVKVPAVLAIFDQLGLRQHAEQVIQEYFMAAATTTHLFGHLKGFHHIKDSLEALGMRTR